MKPIGSFTSIKVERTITTFNLRAFLRRWIFDPLMIGVAVALIFGLIAGGCFGCRYLMIDTGREILKK